LLPQGVVFADDVIGAMYAPPWTRLLERFKKLSGPSWDRPAFYRDPHCWLFLLPPMLRQLDDKSDETLASRLVRSKLPDRKPD
jgi:hypothetical protein